MCPCNLIIHLHFSYLRQSIVNRRIRLHDRTSVISFGLQGNQENLPLVLNFLYQNYAEIRTAYVYILSINKFGFFSLLFELQTAVAIFLTNFDSSLASSRFRNPIHNNVYLFMYFQKRCCILCWLFVFFMTIFMIIRFIVRNYVDIISLSFSDTADQAD